MKRSTVFDRIAAAVFWIRIAIAPVLISLFAGSILYFAVGGRVGTILFALLLSIGVVFGVAFAEWARQKYGPVNFISRSENSTPDIDEWIRDQETQ